MEQIDSKSPIPQWVVHVVIFIVSSTLIGIFLEILAVLGAREFLDGIANDTEAALYAFTPWELVARYLAHVPNYYKLNDWTSAVLYLLRDDFARSVTRTFVDAVQLGAGIAVGIAFVRNVNWHVNIFTVIAASAVATTILSLPILALMFVISETLGHLIPEAPLAIYGGGMSTLVFGVAGRTTEAGLHHGLNKVFERILTRPHTTST